MKRKDFFNSCACSWDKEQCHFKRFKIKEYIIPALNLDKDDNILDIGCGTGILVPFFKSAVSSDNKITELDFSENMIMSAKKKFGNTVNYIVADAGNLPFDKNTFNKIITLDVFPHFENKEKVLCEIFRVLKDDGIAVLAHAGAKNKIDEHHRKVGGIIAEDILPDTDVIKKMIYNAGFKNINIIDNEEVFVIQMIK